MNEAAEAATILGFDLVGAPAGFEHAVRVEDVGEQSLRRLHLHVGERRADIDAHVAVLVAGDADGGEDGLTLLRIAMHCRGGHVVLHDGGAVAAGLAEELLREVGHLSLAALVAPARLDIDPRGGELALLHALEEFQRGGAVGGENRHKVALQRRTGLG